jgi:hypothetical protein
LIGNSKKQPQSKLESLLTKQVPSTTIPVVASPSSTAWLVSKPLIDTVIAALPPLRKKLVHDRNLQLVIVTWPEELAYTHLSSAVAAGPLPRTQIDSSHVVVDASLQKQPPLLSGDQHPSRITCLKVPDALRVKTPPPPFLP